jgi:two-component system cell cycle sensor histidine kinase/response regulator CckA
MDLRWILETLPVGIWVAQVPTGQVWYANPEFRAILGMGAVPGSEIGDAPTTYGIHDRTGKVYPVDRLPFSRVVATGRPAVVDDLVIHRTDGRKVNIRAFAYPTFDGGGKLTHVIVAFLDITQEVRAETERERTESRLSFAVQHAPIVLWSTDATGVVTLSEGAGLLSMGVTSGQLVGSNLFDLYKNQPSIAENLRRGLAGESFWYTTQVGEAVFDTWLKPLRDVGGAIKGLIGLSRDVTELRKLQSSAIQNDRAVALGTLAASVAHEINNPLTYMLGHLGTVREHLEGMERILAGLPQANRDDLSSIVGEMRRSLDPVRAGTERIAGITRELRTFSRPPDEEAILVDVRSVVESVLRLVGKEVEARARLETDLRETAPVRGNATRLIQVVLNLVVNAMQALPGDRPSCDQILVATRDEGERVVIEVSDTGPGVPPEKRERIFEPFVTSKDVGEGTGLGLFVCRNIVRELSGSVTVEDRPGGGARFRIELPAARSRAPDATASYEPSAAAATLPGHVLIIDDDPVVAETLRLQLVSAGYLATVEPDAARALERLAADEDGIDLAFCDLMMREMSGMDLAEALSRRSPAALGRVVFMTGGAFTPRARAFNARYAAQCVDKPFDILAETSRRLLPKP